MRDADMSIAVSQTCPDLDEVGIFIDGILAMIEPVETHFMWRPQLRDPADELVLEEIGRAHV